MPPRPRTKTKTNNTPSPGVTTRGSKSRSAPPPPPANDTFLTQESLTQIVEGATQTWSDNEDNTPNNNINIINQQGRLQEDAASKYDEGDDVIDVDAAAAAANDDDRKDDNDDDDDDDDADDQATRGCPVPSSPLCYGCRHLPP